MKLVSLSYINSPYDIPVINKKLLKEFSSGLIATSACLDGEITYYAAIGDYKNAKKIALEYHEIFNNNFYLEIQNHNIPEELASHNILIKL